VVYVSVCGGADPRVWHLLQPCSDSVVDKGGEQAQKEIGGVD